MEGPCSSTPSLTPPATRCPSCLAPQEGLEIATAPQQTPAFSSAGVGARQVPGRWTRLRPACPLPEPRQLRRCPKEVRNGTCGPGIGLWGGSSLGLNKSRSENCAHQDRTCNSQGAVTHQPPACQHAAHQHTLCHQQAVAPQILLKRFKSPNQKNTGGEEREGDAFTPALPTAGGTPSSHTASGP